jgi:addiction module HigA family antidote
MHDPINVPHPGKIISEVFLKQLGITPYRLAKSTGMSQSHVGEILQGKRNITPLTALRLGHYFSRSPEYFTALQSKYDLARAKTLLGARLDAVVSLKWPSPND